MNWLARLIVDSAEKEYSRASKSLFTLWGFAIFQLIVPAASLAVGLVLDHLLGLGRLLPPGTAPVLAVRLALFIPLFVLGQVFIIWTLVYQLRYSGGTPAFKAPPKRLLVGGPYRYCRNPMVFGYLAYYYGLAVAFASPTALLGFCPALNLLALYVAIHVEEIELAERFGAPYLAYKESVNRMIPMPPALRRGRRSGGSLGEGMDDDRQRA